MAKIMRSWIFAVLTLLTGSALAAPCGGFTDVDDAVVGPTLCGYVDWMKNRAITLGCGTGTYCPSDPVNRLAMAAFMSRLGDRLTPERLFVDANPGPVNIQTGSPFVCQSPPVSLTPPVGLPYPRTAVLHGLAWGLVDAPVVWNADIWYSTDLGVNWNFITNYIPFNAATTSGATQVSTFAQLHLAVGINYVFAIRVRESVDAPSGTGNFTDLACHLMVEIGNRSSTPPAPPPCDSPNATCGDRNGSLAGNR